MIDDPIYASISNRFQRRTFSDLWDRTVARHRERVFLVFEHSDEDNGKVTQEEWSYGEFDAAVGRAAYRLEQLGVHAGGRVHLALANCPAFVALWLAAARVGACIIPGDPGLSTREVVEQLNRTQAVLGICASNRADAYREGAKSAGVNHIELSETGSDLGPDGALYSSSTIARALPVVAQQLLAIMFTSGTTSQPKGVELTQANYRTVAEEMSQVISLGPQHRWFVALPLFHANAQYYCFAPAIAVGASVALVSRFSASSYISQARVLGATHASLFAAPMRMILARTPASTTPAALQHVWFAQNLGSDHLNQFAALVGSSPTQLYGMTETIAAVTANTGANIDHDSIGVAMKNRTLRVLNTRGQPAAAGEVGMLWVKGVTGESLFRGYLEAPDLTSNSIERIADSAEVWFRTGDLVSLGANESYRFVGRIDDVIKVAGENVSLGAVEALVSQAPGVLEAAVLGETDAIRDTVPVAYIVLKDPGQRPTVSELDAWAEGCVPWGGVIPEACVSPR